MPQSEKRNQKKELQQKLLREESKLCRAVQTGTREDLLDCMGSMRGALELCISQFEREAGILPGGNLHERILLLEEKHILDPEQASDAHRIRMITNEAVHFYGNSQDSTTHKYLEHMDKKGLSIVAQEIFHKLLGLAGENAKGNELESVPVKRREDSKAEKRKPDHNRPGEEQAIKMEPPEKDSVKKDPYLVIFLGILSIAFVCLLLSTFFQ